jgi:hypothetical protein
MSTQPPSVLLQPRVAVAMAFWKQSDPHERAVFVSQRVQEVLSESQQANADIAVLIQKMKATQHAARQLRRKWRKALSPK